MSMLLSQSYQGRKTSTFTMFTRRIWIFYSITFILETSNVNKNHQYLYPIEIFTCLAISDKLKLP